MSCDEASNAIADRADMAHINAIPPMLDMVARAVILSNGDLRRLTRAILTLHSGVVGGTGLSKRSVTVAKVRREKNKT